MIHGTITRERLTANDFVKYLQSSPGRYSVFFTNDKAEQVLSIPCESLPEAIQCSELFQEIFEQAIRRHGEGLDTEQRIIDDFHRLWYEKAKIEDQLVYPSTDALYHGLHAQKNPMDLWIYQEILFENRPNLVIECGTAAGASALYLAHVMDQLGHGEIISIDIVSSDNRPQHKRIRYLVGDTLSDWIKQALVLEIDSLHKKDIKTMVILDDDHTYGHVLLELRQYERWVTPGQYLIVEDTNVNGNPVLTGFGPGPKEAVDKFMEENNKFEVDRSREKFLFTTNPGGYLRKK